MRNKKLLSIMDVMAATILLAAIVIISAETWPILSKHFGWPFLAYSGGIVLCFISGWWLINRIGG